MQPTDVNESNLTIFRGRCGDRNDRAMAGAYMLGQALARQTGSTPVEIGRPEPHLGVGWEEELSAALPALRLLSQRIEDVLGRKERPLTVLGRCAAGLATIPVIARHRPDALIVWFDAHADSNTPEHSTTNYLGGMVLSGAAGLWQTGLGDDLDLRNVVLVGSRDIDPSEQALIDTGIVRVVPPGERLAERLREAVAGRPVYIHLDCDVMSAGLLPTEFQVENGLDFDDLRRAAEILAAEEVLGIEIAEFEGEWPDGRTAASPAELLSALEPLTKAVNRAD
ncbi:MAG TPA: arginase family protein [Allosphingosinicella sp.]|uniref:arginase family protein n=1 Tax=Allosphingosinicella sp. TaxID=2823234 RepID=UPI002EDA8609